MMQHVSLQQCMVTHGDWGVNVVVRVAHFECDEKDVAMWISDLCTG